MDENSGSSTATRARGRKEREEGGERRLQSIFIIYLRVSSDWLLPDLCPMARANSRAIAHGYRLSSTESTTESRISSWVSYPPNPLSPFSTFFFIPITSNHTSPETAYRIARSQTRKFAFEVRARFPPLQAAELEVYKLSTVPKTKMMRLDITANKYNKIDREIYKAKILL